MTRERWALAKMGQAWLGVVEPDDDIQASLLYLAGCVSGAYLIVKVTSS